MAHTLPHISLPDVSLPKVSLPQPLHEMAVTHPLSYADQILGSIKHSLLLTTVGLPPEAWWLPALVLIILMAAASVDAFTATIPDRMVLPGLLAVTVAQGFYVSWSYAKIHLAAALVAGAVIWAINAFWFQVTRKDALGMGDAKWTMLAVACFDVQPVLLAWGLGACLGSAWFGLSLLAKKPIRYVYMAPFLFFGLIAGLYWLRLRS